MKKQYEVMKGINPTVWAELEKIAMIHSYNLEERGGIEGRGCDSEDFVDMSIYSIQRMLAAAYLAGKNAKEA